MKEPAHMKIKPNISILNALMRITCGFTLLSWATAKMVRKPYKNSYMIIAMLAGMKVGEGILRYCPVTDLAERGMDRMSDEKEPMKDMAAKAMHKMNKAADPIEDMAAKAMNKMNNSKNPGTDLFE